MRIGNGRVARFIRGIVLVLVFSVGIIAIMGFPPGPGLIPKPGPQATTLIIRVAECSPTIHPTDSTFQRTGKLVTQSASSGSETSINDTQTVQNATPDLIGPCAKNEYDKYTIHSEQTFFNLRPGVWEITASIGQWAASCQTEVQESQVKTISFLSRSELRSVHERSELEFCKG